MSGRWSKAAGIIAVAVVGSFACDYFIPIATIVVPLPIPSVQTRIQLRQGWWEIVVKAPLGSVRQAMWQEWGPADHASLYMTSEGWIAVLGGSTATLIDVAGDAPPRVIGFESGFVGAREIEFPLGVRSETWRYVGATDRIGSSTLRFTTEAQQPECVPQFGVGPTAYRREHQSQDSC